MGSSAGRRCGVVALAATVAFVAGGTGTGRAAGTCPILELPGLPGAVNTWATVVSGGVAAGVSVVPDDTASGGTVGHAVRWDRRGRISDLGTLPGGGDTYAYAVDRDGSVVGAALGADGHTHAVLWPATHHRLPSR